jgi:anti-repressor protein
LSTSNNKIKPNRKEARFSCLVALIRASWFLIKINNMNELIKVKKSEGGKNVISARELHEFLQIETRFDTWVYRMIDYGFTVDIDCSKVSIENQMVDWVLTIECAKHWSMMQRTSQGMLARNYFIECEKDYCNLKKELSRKDLALMVVQAEEARELAEIKIKELTPKAETFDKVMSSGDCIDIGDAAKVLKFGVGRNGLFKRLREQNILDKDNIPYQRFIGQGYFTCIETPIIIGERTRIHVKTLVTQKGINWLSQTLTIQN